MSKADEDKTMWCENCLTWYNPGQIVSSGCRSVLDKSETQTSTLIASAIQSCVALGMKLVHKTRGWPRKEMAERKQLLKAHNIAKEFGFTDVVARFLGCPKYNERCREGGHDLESMTEKKRRIQELLEQPANPSTNVPLAVRQEKYGRWVDGTIMVAR